MCVEREEQGAQYTTLWGSYVQGDGVGGELANLHHFSSAAAISPCSPRLVALTEGKPD